MENSLKASLQRLEANTTEAVTDGEKLIRNFCADLSKTLQQQLTDALDTTGAAIKDHLKGAEQNIASQCKTWGETVALMSSKHHRRALLWSVLIIALTALTSVGLVVFSHYRCKAMEETAAQKLAQTQSQVSFLEEQHQKLFQKFNTLEAYTENGKHFLALSKGWQIKEIREQGGKILWAIVKR